MPGSGLLEKPSTNIASSDHKNRGEITSSTDQKNTEIVEVRREWHDSNGRGKMTTGMTENKQMEAPSRFMLHRWQQESMLDQPYHNLAAVEELEHCDKAKQTSMRSSGVSSNGYLAP
ncbi:MAG: hypothetical protein Q9204_004404 [Flavoplaca sp. TL-2023a]